jgi:hypothetical protein
MGSHSFGSQVTVSAQVISLREMEEAVLAEAESRQAARQQPTLWNAERAAKGRSDFQKHRRTQRR